MNYPTSNDEFHRIQQQQNEKDIQQIKSQLREVLQELTEIKEILKKEVK